MKKNKILLIILVLSVFLFPMCAKGQESGGTVAAKVNGKAIYVEQIDREMARYLAQYAQYGMQPSEEDKAKIKEQVIDQLIARELLLQEAAKQKINADKAEVDKQLADIKTRSGSDENFTNALSQAGFNTEEEFRQEIEDAFILQELIENRVLKDIEVSDEEAKEYYDANPSQFVQPEQVHARHILISLAQDASKEEEDAAYAKIKQVKEELAKGADFAELAKKYSEGPSGPQGGDLGYFGKGQMVKPFEDAAFSLGVGEVSDVVRTQFGLHIIKVEDKKASSVISFDDAKPQLLNMLVDQKKSEKLQQYIEELKSSAKIEKF
ncbi:peptidylprolyl isomerase [Spirochaetia bacterium 38H-sp]|uniref:Peptidylprolyl isomerase n=1 Tax=Rarispira pelagica TaxID=3141764 RepID=A0ABU9U930_9SPIR